MNLCKYLFLFVVWVFSIGGTYAEILEIGEYSDFDSLSSAYQAASPGDELVFTDSRTYEEGLNVYKGNLTIRAEPGQSPTLTGTGSAYQGILHIGRDGIVIDGITFDGEGVSNKLVSTGARTSIIVRNCEFKNASYGLFVLHTKADQREDLIIEDNVFNNNGNDLWLHNVSGGIARNNIANSDNGNGITVGYWSSDMHVLNNTVYSNGNEYLMRNRGGINIQGNDNYVAYNTSYKNTWGISLSQGLNNIIEHNTLWDNTHENVYFSINSNNNTMENNLDYFTDDFEGYGISILLYRSSGNVISQHTSVNASRGVWFSEMGGPSTNNSVINSLFYGNDKLNSIGIDAKSQSYAQNQLTHISVHNYKKLVHENLTFTQLFENDPKLSSVFLFNPTSWALTANTLGQPLGSQGVDSSVVDTLSCQPALITGKPLLGDDMALNLDIALVDSFGNERTDVKPPVVEVTYNDQYLDSNASASHSQLMQICTSSYGNKLMLGGNGWTFDIGAENLSDGNYQVMLKSSGNYLIGDDCSGVFSRQYD
ncbi:MULTISPECIES: nitrous oxide reductase family maturation protein NosD [unclassified Moritella]|uniref:right-handed parallel beta-helix repeat-containing protein n=1 Tax=unclassified Moritella TaxID=2637987 RepID=UPI001BAA4A2C|nr:MULTISPECIES: right-handed parallel beta-helix repeat-containing protein [unclassified Moritella]QUM79916.1 right-handed parallel beta-helix repeat-containing protein [Moritella sp. 5]QUM84144.1 right-handed parallel beta-helix repeat-containing protein [Moritella sp. 28]